MISAEKEKRVWEINELGLKALRSIGQCPPAPEGYDPVKLLAVYIQVLNIMYVQELTLEEAGQSRTLPDLELFEVAKRWLHERVLDFVVEMDMLVDPDKEVDTHWSSDTDLVEQLIAHINAKAWAWYEVGKHSAPEHHGKATHNTSTLLDVWLDMFDAIIRGDVRSRDAKNTVAKLRGDMPGTVGVNWTNANKWLQIDRPLFYFYGAGLMASIKLHSDYYLPLREKGGEIRPGFEYTDGKKLHAAYVDVNKKMRESIIRELKSDPRVDNPADYKELYHTTKYEHGQMIDFFGNDRRDLVVKKRLIDLVVWAADEDSQKEFEKWAGLN